MNTEDKDFLLWLSNRLVYKHGYTRDDAILKKLSRLSQRQDNLAISDGDLDMIISKYYTDFFLEKTDDIELGYTDDERTKLRDQIKLLYEDIVNKNIPQNTIK